MPVIVGLLSFRSYRFALYRFALSLHQADEDLLQRALRRVEVAEADVGQVEVVEQRGDASALALGVVGVDELAAAGRERQIVPRQRGRDRRKLLLQLQRELLLAELAHQLGFVLDEDD